MKLDFLCNSILVAAHPDDEILWFSSILEKVDLTLICFLQSDLFPHLRSGREKTFVAYPIKNVSCLNFDEAPVYNDKNWKNPKIDNYGLNIPDNNPGKKQYLRNYSEIKRELKRHLAGYANVFTHNPWGEYGHEEHVQLFTIINQLRGEMGFNLWFPSYCSNKSFPLMFECFSHFSPERITMDTNKELAHAIKKLYQKNDCWTWSDEFQWVNQETFIRYEPSCEQNKKFYLTIPVNATKIPPFNPPAKSNQLLRVKADKVARRIHFLIKQFFKGI